MNNRQFWFYQLKSFLPLIFAYIFFLALVKLLTILYYVPQSFLGDIVRFSLPLLVIWFFINSYHSSRRLKAIARDKQITANTPVEASLIRAYHLQQHKNNHLSRQLNNHQQEQLDHVELYSHEIKNQLTSLQAAAENNDNVSSKVILKAVNQANYHLDMLLNDERLAISNNDFNFEWIDLQELVTEILKQSSSIFISHQLIPEVHHLSGVFVLTDRKWLRFCINQLLTNAIKYSPNGATIIFNWENDALQIIDQGEGISSTDLPRIYDNGFSGKNGHQTTKSTGMGLYLVKKVTNQLNFSLSINSKVDQGTRAVLHFPGNNVRKE